MLSKANAALNKAGERTTFIVGTMWVALAFAALALVSLPAALHTGDPIVIVSWVAQTFLQLVLLPIILVGQAIQAAKTEARDIETHDAVMVEHAEIKQILARLEEK